MNVWEATIVLLAETNPPVAAAVRAVGANQAGMPLPGLLGWLPEPDRVDLGRAVVLAYRRVPLPAGRLWVHTAESISEVIVGRGGWRAPRGPAERGRVMAAVAGWAQAGGSDPAAVFDLLARTWTADPGHTPT